MDLMEVGPEVVDWIHLAQERGEWQVLVNTAMNFRVRILNKLSDYQLLNKNSAQGVS
jgi:hypothetical protein